MKSYKALLLSLTIVAVCFSATTGELVAQDEQSHHSVDQQQQAPYTQTQENDRRLDQGSTLSDMDTKMVSVEKAEMMILQGALTSIAELEGIDPVRDEYAESDGGRKLAAGSTDCKTSGCIACEITCDYTYGETENICLAACYSTVCLFTGSSSGCKKCKNDCKGPLNQCNKACQNL